MSDRDKSHLHPDLLPLCLQFLDLCHAQNIHAYVISTYRSKAGQAALYAQGRTKPGDIVTWRRGGSSLHEFALPNGTPAAKAFDFGINNQAGKYIVDGTNPLYTKAGNIGKSLGLKWGGDFTKKDWDHLELPE